MQLLNRLLSRRGRKRFVRIAIPTLLIAGLLLAAAVTVAYFWSVGEVEAVRADRDSQLNEWRSHVEEWRPIGILAIVLLTTGGTMFVWSIPGRRAERLSRSAIAGAAAKRKSMSISACAADTLASFEPFLVCDPPGKNFRRLCFGLFSRAAAFACAAAAIYCHARNNFDSWPIVVLVCLILYSLLTNFAHGLFSRRAPEVLARRSNRPILYLRSFASDRRWFESWFDPLRMIVGMPPETAEWSLVKAARGLAPVVAVGRPGERLPPVGAARLYVAHDQWQTTVERLAAQSLLVVLRIGATEGFWWELAHVAKNCDPRRVLIYLPRRDRKRRYELLRQRAAGMLPQPLPTFFLHGYFLAFDSDWTPYRCPIYGPRRVSKFRGFLLRSRAPCIRDGMNDALAALGIPRCGIPFQLREWFAIITGAAMASLVALAVLFVLVRVLLFLGGPT